MKGRHIVALVALAALGALRSVACGCTDELASPSDGGVDGKKDGKLPDVAVETSVEDAGARNCPAGPSGWLLDEQYASDCGFCYRGPNAALPPPIAWEACGSNALPTSAVCRKMATTWKLGKVGVFLSPLFVGWVHDATVSLAFTRFEGPLGYRMVADVDGAVRTSVMEVNTDQCTLGTYHLRDGRFVLRAYSQFEDGGQSAGGAYGLDIDERAPRLYANRKNEPGAISRSYYVSSLGLFETHSGLITLLDWASGKEVQTIDSAATNGGFVFGTLSPDPSAIFWGGFIGTKYNEVRVWTSDGGTRDWLSYGNDWSQGAGDFAADDKDTIWAEGHGRATPGAKFDEVRVMTAPRSDVGPGDGGRIIGRVQPYGLGSGEMGVVGCGYAARPAAPPSGDAMPQETVFIYRLSDGRRWELPQSTAMTFMVPIALTCEELFVSANTRDDGGPIQPNVVRIRVDSLGPGMPAN